MTEEVAMSFDYYHGTQSYGSINTGYDEDTPWHAASRPGVQQRSSTGEGGGYASHDYLMPHDDGEDGFLYHSLSGREGGNGSTVVVSGRHAADYHHHGQTPYMSSANEGISSKEHLYNDDDVLQPEPMGGRASSYLITWNLLNLLLGTGILALPFAIHKGGLVVFGMGVVIAACTYYTGGVLVSCLYENRIDETGRQCKVRVRRDYVELGQDAANSVIGGYVVHVLQLAEMVAVCVLNLIVLGQLCHEIFPSLGIKVCTVIGAVFAFPTVFFRKIQVVAWMQLIGIFSLGIALLLIEGYCFANMSAWRPSTIPIYDLENLSIASGIIIYSFGIHPVLPGIEQHMRHPEKYNIVLFMSFVFTILIQYVVGFTNAALYCNDTMQLITVDLHHHFNLGVASAAFVFLSVVCCFALPTLVVMERIDHGLLDFMPWFGRSSRRHFTLAVIVRMLIIGVAMGVAVIVPHFAYVMGFIGCSVTSVLSLILPCILHLKIKASLKWYEYVVDIVVIFFGIVSMAVGMYHAARAVT